MPITTIETLTKLDEDFTKRYPAEAYAGSLPTDADPLDYITVSLKGVSVA